jgi:amino acid permease
VLGNLRDLIANSYQGRSQVSLMNTLLGAGLVFFFLGRGPLGLIGYVPAIVLTLIAAPLMLGRAVVYTAYVNSARKAIGTVKNVVGSRIRTY